MYQKPVVLTPSFSMRSYWSRARLTWKITGAVLGTLLFCGVLTISIVYLLTSRLLNKQIDQRALGLAKTLADAASGHIATKNFLALHAVVAKYNFQDNVAYAFVRGRNGRALAHSLVGDFPKELESETAADERNVSERRNVLFRDRPVYESVVPILAGQLGSAHVGIWGDTASTEIHRSLLPIIGLIGFLFLVASAVFLLLARHIVKRIIRLQSIADKMSKGNLEESVSAGLGDEIDELGMSLERMRTSLKAAMTRLRSIDSRGPMARQQGDANAKARA